MHRQILKIGKNDRISIATPLGLIELARPGGRHGKGWELTLPNGLNAFKSRDKAIQASPFLAQSGGTVKPAYTLLVPQTDSETGELIGVNYPTSEKPLRVGLPVGDKKDDEQTATEVLERVESPGGGNRGGYIPDEAVSVQLPVG